MPGKTVWSVRRGIQLENVPPRPLVFCGIARPKSFVSQLRASGIEPSALAFFRDHRAYTNADVDNLLRLRDKHCAEGFLTTEKDVINLGGHRLGFAPLAVAKVTMHLKIPITLWIRCCVSLRSARQRREKIVVFSRLAPVKWTITKQ